MKKVLILANSLLVFTFVCILLYKCTESHRLSNKLMSELINVLEKKDTTLLKKLTTQEGYNEIMGEGISISKQMLLNIQGGKTRVDKSEDGLTISYSEYYTSYFSWVDWEHSSSIHFVCDSAKFFKFSGWGYVK